jgi:hypothetical protein
VLSRRTFLRGSTAAVLALPLLPLAGRAAAAPLDTSRVPVRPRADWAQGLAPTGPLATERPEDVRFLLVHHSASPNGYAPEEVPGLLREYYALHTGPTRGWPDIAYNFLVDRYGTVWEGREGSLSAPVSGDATGGSQGFAVLCCFIGDHTTEPPTAEAQAAMTSLLAELAAAYGIDPSPGQTAEFVSRGSSRWPAGTTVTTPTIAGHRDMSVTSCPGDAAYGLVTDVFPAEVATLAAALVAAAPATTTTVTTPSATSPPPAAPVRLFRTAGPSSPEPPTPSARAAEADDPSDLWPATFLTAGVLALAAAFGLRRPAGRHRAPAAAEPQTRAPEARPPQP